MPNPLEGTVHSVKMNSCSLWRRSNHHEHLYPPVTRKQAPHHFLAPVRPGGANKPLTPMPLSPQHRLQLRGWQALDLNCECTQGCFAFGFGVQLSGRADSGLPCAERQRDSRNAFVRAFLAPQAWIFPTSLFLSQLHLFLVRPVPEMAPVGPNDIPAQRTFGSGRHTCPMYAGILGFRNAFSA